MWLALGDPGESGGWWDQRVDWGPCSEGGGKQLKVLNRMVM